MKNLLLTPLIVIASLLFTISATGQKTLQLQSNPELKISGTSTLHDWVMSSQTANGSLSAIETDGNLTEIKTLTVTMQAESIKSGKKAMDKKAYEAMKTDKHKTVTFLLKNASKTGDVWTLNGTFSIAGTTKNVSLKAKESSNSGSYTLEGNYRFKLTDYGITPPTAMMGTIKTGDEVTVSFNVKFK